MADDPKNHTPLQTSNPQKEAAPVSAAKAPETEPVSTRSQETKAEPQPEKKLAPEVAEYIKHHDEKVKIPEALKQIGVEADAKDQSFDEVVEGPKLPMSDQQISDGLKKPMNMSVKWLSMFLLYILQQSHYTIKTVHGTVKRIVKP